MSELSQLTKNPYHNHAQAILPGISQKISFTAANTVSSLLSKDCTIVRLFPTENCYIKIASTSPTATNTDVYCPGGIIQYFAIKNDAQYYVAVIRDTTSGTLHILEGL